MSIGHLGGIAAAPMFELMLQHFDSFRLALSLYLRNTPSTAGNSMTSSERPSPEPILKKEASPAVLGGERILETLWKPQMP